MGENYVKTTRPDKDDEGGVAVTTLDLQDGMGL